MTAWDAVKGGAIKLPLYEVDFTIIFDFSVISSTYCINGCRWILNRFNQVYFYRDFFGPTFSGVITSQQNFGYTMTYYSIACMAAALFIVIVKIYQALAKCYRKSTLTIPDTEGLIANT